MYGRREFLHRPSTGPSVAGTGPSAILPAVEQLRGPVIPPVTAAGTDPAYIPGLTPPGPDRAGEEAAAEEVEQTEQETPSGETSGEASGEAVPEESAEDAAGSAGPSSGAAAAGEPEDGPVFEASDRRGSIAAGPFGLVFRLDGEEARFPWDEIGAVETDLPRFGRRFSVSVCTTARRWYEADVDAPSRKVLKEWDEEFDAVLDEWFDED
ncbi:hypothetical protein SAMN05216481_1034 [Streptomyces radiopugnans]|uniref:Uncharacterized protein n=1 Tax=Streptomyces radiopugnans TaxID=403935 RepID=A0A1H9C3A0_9ACTN|nr:hypothetical protein SAMN05216481_1034 [Streptomyces radiopugnans]